MSKRRKTSRPGLPKTAGAPGADSTAPERVEWLLKTVWRGNQSLMAREVGCGPSVISKIVARQQDVGTRLLMKIATHPSINPGWLLSGEGDPFLSANVVTPPATPDSMQLPIAKQLLSGPPEFHHELLSGEKFPAPAPYARSTAYWLELQSEDPIVQHGGHNLRAGDLLLMETDVNFRKSEEMVDGELCAVRVRNERSKGGRDVKLAMVHCTRSPEEGPLEAETFE